MTATDAQRALRRAALSAALLLAAAPVALADPPGYDFMDFQSAANDRGHRTDAGAAANHADAASDMRSAHGAGHDALGIADPFLLSSA